MKEGATPQFTDLIDLVLDTRHKMNGSPSLHDVETQTASIEVSFHLFCLNIFKFSKL